MDDILQYACYQESAVDDLIYDINNFYDGVITHGRLFDIMEGRGLDWETLPEYLQYKICCGLTVIRGED